MQEDRKRFDKASLVYDQVVFSSENFIHHIEVCTRIFFFPFPDNFLDKFQIFFFIKNMVSCAPIIFIFVRFEYLYLFMVPFSSFIVAIFASFSASVYVCAFLMLSSFISKIIHQLGSLFY